ncbi:MAG: LacI family DNA-binding transcriptional regulator [Parvularculaceae bacterium]|nr:LacI family DNA-binding transcriptional regulator [Parvularculaceae bacterium]
MDGSGDNRRSSRLEDLAALAGVSIATVSRALNNSPAVREETKRRIWKLAREHNYPFRPHMPAILSGASATIAIVIPTPQGRKGSLDDPFYMELIGGVGEAAREAGCDILISHVAPKNFDDLSDLMESSRAEGVVFLGQSFLHERFNRLVEARHRFVVWGADLPGQRYCSIGSDNIKGGKRATSHLLRLGRKRIAFFGDTEAPEVQQRYAGYLQALAEAEIALDPNLVAPAHFEVESAEDAVERLLSMGVKFDAVFGASDLIAIGAIRGLMRRGVAVPRDCSVVGYDDILLARYSHPALSTISQDMAKAGRLLVSRLLSSAEGAEIRSERLPTELIVRESCGA